MNVIPERLCVTDLTPEERIRNHGKHQTYAKGKRQQCQKGSHCVRMRLLGIPGEHHNEKGQGKEDEGMKDESERCGTSISGNPGDDAIHKAEGHGIGHQEEDQGRIQRKLHFQTSRERHLEYVGNIS